MGRILAIDYGTKRTGIAVTDPLQIIASPLEVVPSHKLLDYLSDYFTKETVDRVVIGMPKNIDGRDTDATMPVKVFVKHYRKHFPDKELILHDERFTSKMAEASILSAGASKKTRQNKGLVDKVSASIILQSYLQSIQ